MFRVLAVAVSILVALGLGLGITLGVVGLAGNQPSTPEALRSLAQSDGSVIVFSEFGETSDTIFAADPNDPSRRTELGRVEHALGYGIAPKLSPDGGRIAYAVLPAGTRIGGQATNAELWVMDTEGGKQTRLAQGADLTTTPIWSPGGDELIICRESWSEAAPGSSELLRVDLEGVETLVAAAEGDLFPIDFSPDGSALYYGVASETGTEVFRASIAGGESTVVARVGERWGRSWQLSPDGSKIAYLGEVDGAVEVAPQVQVLDLATGEIGTPLARGDTTQVSVVWDTAGDLTVGRIDPASEHSAPMRVSPESGAEAAGSPAAAADGAGFDVPLSWSPDGRWLVVRGFEGVSVSDPGPSWVYVIGPAGERRKLSQQSDVIVAGWLEAPQ